MKKVKYFSLFYSILFDLLFFIFDFTTYYIHIYMHIYNWIETEIVWLANKCKCTIWWWNTIYNIQGKSFKRRYDWMHFSVGNICTCENQQHASQWSVSLIIDESFLCAIKRMSTLLILYKIIKFENKSKYIIIIVIVVCE